MSDPNFVWRLSFTDILILASQITVFDTSYSAKQGITQCFDLEYKRIPKNGAKGSFLGGFLDPSSPMLASGSLGP